MEQNSKIFYPSFKFERKTRALNKYKLPFVALISMFTVSIFVGGFIYAFTSSFLELPINHLFVYIFIPFIIFLLSIVKLTQFFLILLNSYKFEDNKIIKGTLSKTANFKEADLGIVATAAVAIVNSNLLRIAKLIKLNTVPEFVTNYFDTEFYGKKEYTNPKLIKETKYMLVYKCDNGILKIPKLYEGLSKPSNVKERLFVSRIITTSILVFVIALAIAIGDLTITNYNTMNEYRPKITASQNKLEDELDDYGYSLDRSGSNNSTFKKKVGDRTSTLTYTYDKKGNIKKVKVQLYYNSASKKVESELRTIIDTIDTDFDEDDIDEFIETVCDCLDGEYKTYKLSSKNNILVIGRSGDYVDIH